MVVAPIPSRESARLDALYRSHILDTPSEPAFDELARLAAYVCRTPMAVISLVDSTRQWFKSVVGLPYTESPRSTAFCAHTILGTDLFIVEEADADERFADHPWVVKPPSIRFYAGVPLITPDGHAIGSLAVMDVVPRSLTPEQRTAMHTLATQVMAQLTLRNGRRAWPPPSIDPADPAARAGDVIDRGRAAEGERSKQEMLLALMLNTGPGCIKRVAADGTLLHMNPAGLKLIEAYCEQDVLGCSVFDLVLPEHRAAFMRMHQEVIQGAARTLQFEIQGLQGTRRWMESHAVPFHNPVTGRTEHLAMIYDITERKRSEDIISHGRERMRSFITHAPAPIAMLDKDLRYVAVSRRWLEDYRLGEQDIVGKHHYDVFPEIRTMEEWQAIHQRCLAGAVERREEQRFVRTDGSENWLRWEVRPWLDAGGAIGGIIMFTEDITERKRSETALRESEERLRLAMETAGMGAWDWEAVSNAATYSPTLGPLFGLAPGDRHATVEEFLSVIVPEDRERVSLAIGRCLDGGTPFCEEYRTRWPDGTVRWLSDRGQVYRNEQGQSVRMLGVVMDITERKRTEDALRMTQYAVDHADDQIFIIDSDGSFIDVNESACRRLGYTKQELLTMSVMDIDPDFPVATWTAFWAEFRERPRVHLETRHRSKSGEIYPVEVTANFLSLGGREFDCAVVRDITERKGAEAQLRRSEAYFRALIEQSADIVTVLGLDGRIRFESPSFERLLGYTQHELDGQSAFDYIHQDDVSVALDTFERIVREPGALHRAEFRFRQKDGSWRNFEGVGRVGEDSQGQPCVIVNSRDITERTRVQEEQAKQERLISLMLNTGPGCIKRVAADGTLLHMNPAGLKLIEACREEEAVGRSVFDLVLPEHREAFIRMHQDVIGGAARTLQFKVQGLQGTRRWMESHAVPFHNPVTGDTEQLAITYDISERKRGEEALRLSQERLHQALRASDTGLWEWNTETDDVSLSREWKRQLGYRETELPDRFETWASRLHPDDRDRAIRYAQGYRDHPAGTFRLDFRLRHKDGSYRWIDSHASFVTEPDGRRIRLLGAHTDITERKHVEEALRQSEERFRAAYRNATVGMSIADLDGRICEVNAALCTILGYSEQDLLTRTFQSITHPDDLDQNLQRVQRLLAGDVSLDVFEKRYIGKGGEIVWAEVGLSVIRDVAGAPVHTLALVQDITERKRAEQALRESQERFHSAIDATNEGIWDWNIATDTVYFSPQWIRLLGYAPEEVPPSTDFFFSILHPEDVARTTAVLQEHLSGHIPVKELELRLRQKSGEYRWYLDRGKVVARSQDGRPLRMVGTIADISMRKLAEQERARALHSLQIIMETVPDVIFALDLEGRLSQWNPRMEVVTGYGPDELFLKPALEMVPLDEAARTSAAITEAFEAEYAELEGHLLAKDGRAIPYHWTGAPFTDLDGRVLGITGVGRDVTERKRAEAALRLTRFSIERAVDAVFWIDAQARILDINDAACMVLGYTRDELLSMTMHDIDPKCPAEAWPAHWAELKARKSFSFETGHMRKDGTVIQTEMTVNFLIHEGQEYNCAILRDISVRKHTEDLLRFNEERFRLVAEATNDILWDWDLLTNEHWWSPNAQGKFGYNPNEEPSIAAWTNRLHPEDRDRVMAIIADALASEARTVTAEYCFRLADGSYGHFYDRGQIVRDASGRPVRMIGAMIDVTFSKRAYASLETAYQRLQSMSRELQSVESNERRRLSRELHDEVGQLLTGLKFDLEATRRALGDTNAAGGARAQERIRRALETTDELFARLRRIVRALRPPVLEELGLKEALEAMVSEVQSRSDLACSVSIEADGLEALTDTTIESGLYRMAQELATNVVRHGQAMTMSVILTADSRHWILTVQDDGVGFDPKIESINGMGLRGIRERAEILGGRVDISSTPGAGSTVTVWIPVAGQAPEKA